MAHFDLVIAVTIPPNFITRACRNSKFSKFGYVWVFVHLIHRQMTSKNQQYKNTNITKLGNYLYMLSLSPTYLLDVTTVVLAPVDVVVVEAEVGGDLPKQLPPLLVTQALDVVQLFQLEPGGRGTLRDPHHHRGVEDLGSVLVALPFNSLFWRIYSWIQ